ncbi:MAG: hypothetical protein BAJALOKI2v1_110001 [Promethearchaeota archaeon]|nr:MAG: hypothetical protein BAJALOKI2v1_110001 [Candidatus Lokiarchaeota archaeon]
MGLAYTLPEVVTHETCSKIKLAGKIADQCFLKVLEWCLLPLSIQKIVGIATLNAISQYIMSFIKYKDLEIDLMKHLNITADSNITFIGLIKPLIRKVGSITESITIIDRNTSLEQFKSYKLLSTTDNLSESALNTDIVFCTGTSLINNTLDQILELYRTRVQDFILIGPSAGLIPDILFEKGVTVVGGMRIIDIENTFKIIQEGGGTKFFKEFGEKYNLISES